MHTFTLAHSAAKICSAPLLPLLLLLPEALTMHASLKLQHVLQMFRGSQASSVALYCWQVSKGMALLWPHSKTLLASPPRQVPAVSWAQLSTTCKGGGVRAEKAQIYENALRFAENGWAAVCIILRMHVRTKRLNADMLHTARRDDVVHPDMCEASESVHIDCTLQFRSMLARPVMQGRARTGFKSMLVQDCVA